METFNIVTVIAIILFARLGVRIVYKAYSQKNKDGKEED